MHDRPGLQIINPVKEPEPDKGSYELFPSDNKSRRPPPDHSKYLFLVDNEPPNQGSTDRQTIFKKSIQSTRTILNLDLKFTIHLREKIIHGLKESAKQTSLEGENQENLIRWVLITLDPCSKFFYDYFVEWCKTKDNWQEIIPFTRSAFEKTTETRKSSRFTSWFNWFRQEKI